MQDYYERISCPVQAFYKNKIKRADVDGLYIAGIRDGLRSIKEWRDTLDGEWNNNLASALWNYSDFKDRMFNVELVRFVAVLEDEEVAVPNDADLGKMLDDYCIARGLHRIMAEDPEMFEPKSKMLLRIFRGKH